MQIMLFAHAQTSITVKSKPEYVTLSPTLNFEVFFVILFLLVYGPCITITL